MNQFNLITPAGQAAVLIGVHHLPDRITRQIVRDETEHFMVPRLDPNELPIVGGSLPIESATTRQDYKLLPMFNFSHDMREAITKSVNSRSAFTEARDERIKEFVCDRFKALAAKKKTEFYVANFNLEEAEKLSIKYLENFGSSNCMLLLFKMSEYHKFAAMIDSHDAFKLVMTEVGTKGELIELNPNRWVLGRYGEDLTLIKEMHENQRYVSNHYPGNNR